MGTQPPLIDPPCPLLLKETIRVLYDSTNDLAATFFADVLASKDDDDMQETTIDACLER